MDDATRRRMSLGLLSDLPAFRPKTPPGPELRNYEPSLLDYGRQALDSAGQLFGYHDLPERTQETFDLLSLPLMFAPLSGPAQAAKAGSGPGWDNAMARVLQGKYPEEKAITGGAPQGYGIDAYWNSSRGLSRMHDLPPVSQMNAMKASPPAAAGNDRPPMSDEQWRYLEALFQQRSRTSLKPIR